MSNCDLLKQIQNKIATGTPPEEAIPYSIHCDNADDFLEVIYYASQVLPEGRRKEYCIKRLEEMRDVTRTDKCSQ